MHCQIWLTHHILLNTVSVSFMASEADMSCAYDVSSVTPSTSAVHVDVTSASSDSSSLGSNSDFEMPVVAVALERKFPVAKQSKQSVITNEVAAVSQALGCNTDDVTVSHTTIQHARKEIRNCLLVHTKKPFLVNALFCCTGMGSFFPILQRKWTGSIGVGR